MLKTQAKLVVAEKLQRVGASAELGVLFPIFLESDRASVQKCCSDTSAFFKLTFASDAELHIRALQGSCVEQQQPNTAGKILELRKAPGSGPLLPGVTGFCLEAFLTVAVNNAAAFLQATLERAC